MLLSQRVAAGKGDGSFLSARFISPQVRREEAEQGRAVSSEKERKECRGG